VAVALRGCLLRRPWPPTLASRGSILRDTTSLVRRYLRRDPIRSDNSTHSRSQLLKHAPFPAPRSIPHAVVSEQIGATLKAKDVDEQEVLGYFAASRSHS